MSSSWAISVAHVTSAIDDSVFVTRHSRGARQTICNRVRDCSLVYRFWLLRRHDSSFERVPAVATTPHRFPDHASRRSRASLSTDHAVVAP